MSGNKQRRFTDEFKREAVRLIETSGQGKSSRPVVTPKATPAFCT
jgi:transposase-like protein